MTFEGLLERSRGRTSGFDALRLILAVAVIVFHSLAICYGKPFMDELWQSRYAGMSAMILHMFFALGGFLVAGSFDRCSLGEFFAFRLFRVVPALTLVVVVCVFVIGPAVTVLPLGEYFRSGETYLYLANSIGYTRYELPGVFRDLPISSVNVPLWTIVYEFACYEALAFLSIFGLYRRRAVFLAILIGLTVAGPFLLDHAKFDTTLSGKVLFVTFMWGVAIYRFRDCIADSREMFAGCLLFAVVALSSHTTSFLGAPAAAYVTVYLGLRNAPRIPLVLNGDYSYGLYLIGWPLGQLHALWFPHSRVWWENSLFSIALGLGCAALSWHLVEYPILKRRRDILRSLASLGRLFKQGVALPPVIQASGEGNSKA